jgi:4a-hydroxytetrahydrobiopterin dehydratase
MVQPINSKQFHETPGVADWRVLSDGAAAYFATGSFAKGLEFVDRIGELADAANHHPDIDLRYAAVLVKLMTHEVKPNGWLSERDASLAAQISDVARELQLAADPAKVQTIQIAIDAVDIPTVQAFWAAVLGREPSEEDLFDDAGLAPNFWFQQMDAARGGRNRIHIDLYVPADQAQARITAALAAGGTVLHDYGPQWWTLADPEGNEVDIAPWPDNWPGWDA